MKRKQGSNLFLYLVIIVGAIALALFFFRTPGTPPVETGSVTRVAQLVQQRGGNVVIVQEGESLLVTDKSEPPQQLLKASFSGSTYELQQYLLGAGVTELELASVDIRYKTSGFNWGSVIITTIVPLILLAGLFLFLARRSRSMGGGQAFNFSRTRARVVDGSKPSVTFADVAGADESKQELQEIVEFLKSPGKFASLGAKIPRGVLLVGPPGTGKTLLARAVAGEAGVPFFSISGSEFVEMFVGVGASRVRDLFDQAKRAAPAIVFVDEIDAVGRQRGAGLGGGHDEREQTLNQLLVEMDGFDTSTNIIVIAATNRPDILDSALLRPGRFDRQVVMDRPDVTGRTAILKVHSRNKPLEDAVKLEVLAKQTVGFSGADLANLLNEAALLAARRDKKKIGMPELEESIDRVIAGPQKKTRVIGPKEKELTAYHEAGHAIVANALPNADRVHKISIVARGMMGGYTRLLPEEDRYLWSRSQFNDVLATQLAGHATEQLIFGEITTGAANDLEQATKLARKMVTEYGMSEKLGPRTFGHREEMVFLGREITEQRDYSEKVAQEIDEEVRQLIHDAYDASRRILIRERDKVVCVAKALMVEETLEGEQLQRLLCGADALPSAQPNLDTTKKRWPIWRLPAPSQQVTPAI